MDAFASHRHLLEHLLPVWTALPEVERGTFYAASKLVRRWARELGVETVFRVPDMPGPAILIANHADYQRCHPGRPVVYLEHGAGQSYVDVPEHPSYSGGKDRDRVAAFLTLNPHTARRESAVYGSERVHVVGSPRLDVLSEMVRAPRESRPVVAFAWHWDCGLVPETRWAFPAFQGAVKRLAASGRYSVLGHGHPRVWPQLRRWYEAHGIEAVGFRDVLARADVLCVDNSSVGYEAAALGIPTIWLNAPVYRKDVEHGLRFWSHVPGPQVDDPAELEGAIVERLNVPGRWPQRSSHIADQVYPSWTRGQAAELAARISGNLPDKC